MRKTIAFSTSIAAISALIIGCGGGGGGAASVTTNSYSGPGSDYSLNMSSNNQFTLTEADSSLSLTGSWASLSSGFRKLTVSTSNQTGNVPVGSSAYVLEVPGVMTLLKPIGSNTQIINMVTSGSCPSSDVTANWVNTNKNINMSTQKSNRDLFGTYSYTHSTTSAILPQKYAFDETGLGSSNLGTLTCNNGIVTGSSFKMYLTQAGGAIVRTEGSDNTLGNTDDDLIISFPTDTLSAGELDGTYSGLVFEESGTSENIFPVSMTFSGTTGSGFAFTNVDTNTLSSTDSVGVSITSSLNQPANGFFSIQITDKDSNTGTAKCMANSDVVNSGKNLIYCIGENPGDNSKLYNLLLVSK